MRGPDEQTSGMFSYLSLEQRVRTDHPLRVMRRMTDEVFAASSGLRGPLPQKVLKELSEFGKEFVVQEERCKEEQREEKSPTWAECADRLRQCPTDPDAADNQQRDQHQRQLPSHPLASG
jgi:hypothetical protein